MANRKRGVQYTQGEEPAFLKRMKEQAGFKAGPTIDTKREELQQDCDSDHKLSDDEMPQVG